MMMVTLSRLQSQVDRYNASHKQQLSVEVVDNGVMLNGVAMSVREAFGFVTKLQSVFKD